MFLLRSLNLFVTTTTRNISTRSFKFELPRSFKFENFFEKWLSVHAIVGSVAFASIPFISIVDFEDPFIFLTTFVASAGISIPCGVIGYFGGIIFGFCSPIVYPVMIYNLVKYHTKSSYSYEKFGFP